MKYNLLYQYITKLDAFPDDLVTLTWNFTLNEVAQLYGIPLDERTLVEYMGAMLGIARQPCHRWWTCYSNLSMQLEPFTDCRYFANTAER